MKEKQETSTCLCAQGGFEDLFALVVCGDATPEQEEAMELHLSECEDCAAAMRMFRALHEVGPNIFKGI